MPVPVSREPEAIREALQQWFDARPDAEGVVVNDDVSAPIGAGNANETIFFSLTRAGAGSSPERMVLRIAPTAFNLFMDQDFAGLTKVTQALAGSAAYPMPEILWLEEDDAILGAPFCVMRRADGEVPPDNVNVDSWVVALGLEDQRRLWENGFATLCSIHADPGSSAALEVLGAGLEGRSGLRAELDHWAAYPEWAGIEDARAQRLLDWLMANVPASIDEPSNTALSWGDARMENLIFGEDLVCTAVLDWEMVSLGGPLLDLAWWLNFDRFNVNMGVGRPEGYASREDTIARWEQLTGIDTTDLPWHEVFAAYRLGLIMLRMTKLYAVMGIEIPDIGGICMGGVDSLVEPLARP